MFRLWSWIACLSVVALATGCARCRYGYPCQQEECCLSTPVVPLSSLLPAGARGSLKMSLDASVPPQHATQHEYRVLAANDCQCLAAKHSSLANMLDEQACRIAQQTDNCSVCDRVLIDLLHAVSYDMRNASAAGALELYYTIAQLEAQRDLLDQSIAELQQAEADVEQARGAGISVPLKSDDLTFQRLESEKKRLTLEAGLAQANRQLSRLLGAEWGSASVRIWPEANIAVTAQSFDAESEVAQGMSGHPEIAALRQFACSECLENLPTMRQIVAGTSAFLAVRLVPGALLFGKLVAALNDDPIETAQRQRQILQLASQQELEARDNIRLAIETIGANYAQAVYARQIVQRWETQVADLERAREADKSEPSDVVEAKLKRIQAKSSLVEAVVAWQTAQVKLRAAQGSLASECGFSACGPGR